MTPGAGPIPTPGAGGDGGKTTRLEREQGVYLLTLDRPSAGNSVNTAMVPELEAALEAVERDPDAAALILTGAGDRFFCTGGDVKEYATIEDRSALVATFLAIQSVARRLELLPVPTVAAINGVALGGGVEISLACDFRVARAGATLGLPQVRLGVINGWGGHWRLPRVVGQARALDLALTGRTVAAEEALALGLVNRVGASALGEAVTLVEELRKAPPAALRAMKVAVRRAGALGYDESQAEVNEVFFELWFSEAHRAVERALLKRRSSPKSPGDDAS